MDPLICPSCDYEFRVKNTIDCPRCHSRYRTEDLDEVSRLLWEIERVKDWGDRQVVSPGEEQRLLAEVRHDLQAARTYLGRVTVEAPAQVVAARPAAEAEPPVAPTPIPAPTVAPQPPRARRPIFKWSEIGLYLLSERTLNGLLGLGAFLILAAGIVISTINPTGLAAVPHLAATLATTVVLYAAGYYVRQKLDLVVVGTALLAIGAVFIPLAVWTLGRDTALAWDRDTIWLLASTLCLPIYLASHVLFRDRVFAALTAVAGGSEVLAIAHRAGVPMEWGICALVVLAMGYLVLSTRLSKTWKSLSWALFWSAQCAVPLAMLTLIGGKFYSDQWRDVVTQAPTASFDYAAGGAWWLGVVFYLLAARLFRLRVYEYAAAWITPLAFLLTLTKAPWGAAWYGVCLGLLAIGYFVMEAATQGAWTGTFTGLPLRVASRPLYGVAIALTIAALSWPFATRLTLLCSLITVTLAYGLAAWLLRRPEWGYVSILLLPAVYGLGQVQLGVPDERRPLAWMALALVAPAVAVVFERRGRTEGSNLGLPLYLVGYSVSIAAMLLPVSDPAVSVVVVGLSFLLYAWSAWRVHQGSHRLYLWLLGRLLGKPDSEDYRMCRSILAAIASVLFPVWLALAMSLYRPVLPASAYGLAFAILAPVYVAAGLLLRRADPDYHWPAYLVGFSISGLSLYQVLGADHWLVMLTFGLAAALYAASAAVFRRSLFCYPAAIALAVVYVVGVVTIPLDSRYTGLALLPGIAAYFAVAAILRRRLDSVAPSVRPRIALRFTSWSTSFWLILFVGTLAVPTYAGEDWPVLAASLFCVGAVYLASAALFRHPAWLYPAIAATLGGQLAIVHAVAPSLDASDVAVTLIPSVWALAWLADGVARLSRREGRWTLQGSTPPWIAGCSRPLLIAGVVTLALSTAASINAAGAGLKTGLAYLVLLLIFSIVRRNEYAAFGGALFIAISVQEALRLVDIAEIHQPPVWAAVGFLAALCCLGLSRVSPEALAVWKRPLYFGSLTAGALAVLGAIGNQNHLATRAPLEALALTVAITGLIAVTHSVIRRDRRLAYAGVALLLAGGLLEMAAFKVGQPQAFVLPAGIYLLVIAYLEWRRGVAGDVKAILESAALIVLLGTSLLQAVGYFGAGSGRYTYDAYLLVESVAMFGLGSVLRWKRTFFAGAAALVADVLIMLADPLRAMNTWYLVALIGFVMIGLVLFIEQRRRQIPLWIDTWRQQLESWA